MFSKLDLHIRHVFAYGLEQHKNHKVGCLCFLLFLIQAKTFYFFFLIGRYRAKIDHLIQFTFVTK